MYNKLTNILNPVPSDIVVAQSIEPVPVLQIARSLGIPEDHIDLYGKYKAKVCVFLVAV